MLYKTSRIATAVETAFVATHEVILFARSHVLLNNQASVNVFCNGGLLTDIRRSKQGILLNGVQAGVKSVRVDLEGDFEEVGPVYFSRGATANILSFAAWSIGVPRFSTSNKLDDSLCSPREAATSTASIDNLS